MGKLPMITLALISKSCYKSQANLAREVSIQSLLVTSFVRYVTTWSSYCLKPDQVNSFSHIYVASSHIFPPKYFGAINISNLQILLTPPYKDSRTCVKYKARDEDSSEAVRQWMGTGQMGRGLTSQGSASMMQRRSAGIGKSTTARIDNQRAPLWNRIVEVMKRLRNLKTSHLARDRFLRACQRVYFTSPRIEAYK